jgi:hypothetical protein
MTRPFGILSRSERRAMERAKDKHIQKLVDGGYGPWKDITNTEETQDLILQMRCQGATYIPEQIWVNGLFVVQKDSPPNSWGAVRIMIRWADARPEHNWPLFQRIKNDLFGEHRTALEVYPSEANKSDVANMYWLWILPEEFDCPIEVKGGG